MIVRDWIEIVPAKGEEKETIRALLALAEHSSHVRSQQPSPELLVPPYLADLFTKPKPRRGRPKKEVEEEQ